MLLVLLFLFLTPSLGWGGAGEDTGLGTGGLAKVMGLMVGPGAAGGGGGWEGWGMTCWLARLLTGWLS